MVFIHLFHQLADTLEEEPTFAFKAQLTRIFIHDSLKINSSSLFKSGTQTYSIEIFQCLFRISERQLDNAKQIAEAYERMKQTGDANQLEYNKAVLN